MNTAARRQMDPEGTLEFVSTVYAPQHDSFLLSGAIRSSPMPEGASVLDLCTGSGIQAVTAASMGAGSVLALDIASAAVAATEEQAAALGLPIEARWGDLDTALDCGPVDVVVCNPPYVPSPHAPPLSGPSLAWDAGQDGRSFLDPLCRAAPELLNDNGFLLTVQSEHSGIDETMQLLQQSGLRASIVASTVVPFGPVLRSRVRHLESRGLIARGTDTETLVVIRAEKGAST